MKISILGCGWLGLSVGKSLSKEHDVKGSTTRSEKLREIKRNGIEPFLIKIYKDRLDGDIGGFFDCDILYLNVPPGRRNAEVLAKYPDKLERVLERLNPETRVMYISSTGVYPNTNGIVTEEFDLSTDLYANNTLVKAEVLVKTLCQNWVILRMSGLVGPRRHPGRWFANKSEIPNGLAPVNLVHLKDCISISEQVIKSNISNEVFNVCADEHPTRMDFYRLQSKLIKMKVPEFKSEVAKYKIISNQKIKNQLNYKFHFPDPMKFVF